MLAGVRLSSECRMNDGFSTTDLGFASGLLYLYGIESLNRIELVQTTRARAEAEFFIDAPSLDCQSYLSDYQSGQFPIGDLKTYCETYSRLVKWLKVMRKDNETSWTSPSWVAGRGR